MYYPSTPTPHTDLWLLRSKWCRLYWLCKGRRLKDRLTCPTEHMGRGNLHKPLGEECNTGICLLHAYKYTLTCEHTHTSLVHSPYFYSNFRIEISTGYEATCTTQTPTHPHSCKHTANRHRPLFDETQVLEVGGKKADGQVDFSHCTHREGRHHPVGEPTQTTGRRRVSFSA